VAIYCCRWGCFSCYWSCHIYEISKNFVNMINPVTISLVLFFSFLCTICLLRVFFPMSFVFRLTHSFVHKRFTYIQASINIRILATKIILLNIRRLYVFTEGEEKTNRILSFEKKIFYRTGAFIEKNEVHSKMA
jgi:hypothetical protein